MADGKGNPFFLTRFFNGAACSLRAVGIIVRTRRILFLSLTPFLLCLLIYVAFLVTVVFLADNVADLIIEPGQWWRTVIRTALIIAVILAFIVLAVFTYTLVCFAVAGPFYDLLSGAVEKKLAGRVEEEPFSIRNTIVDVGRSVFHAVVMLAMELCVLILGLLLVPVTTVLALMASSVLLALAYLHYPMGRRRWTLRQKLRFGRRHAWELLGLGLPLLVGLMVPLVGAVFLPVGVVGGTVLFLQLAERARTGADEPPQKAH